MTPGASPLPAFSFLSARVSATLAPMAKSLLRRIERAADPTSNERRYYRGDDLESAVVEHLKELLNTRRGASLSAPDYGIDDVAELARDFPDSLADMQRAIKNTLLKYEPRLKNVQVRAVKPDTEGADLVAHFEVTAQLIDQNGERQPFRFRTSMDEDGVEIE